jgi:hypothetical protein
MDALDAQLATYLVPEFGASYDPTLGDIRQVDRA